MKGYYCMHKLIKKLGLAVLSMTIAVTGHLYSSESLVVVQAADSIRIHYLTLPENTEAILLECNGQFGMVDSGEDTDYPDGSDSRYPDRDGITKTFGFEDEVIAYLKSAGVTTDNFEFYIGTHPHSDHIGSADEVIRAFHPKRVYIQEYKDSYISSTGNLWDNLYVYDNMISAAKDTGATLIQNFDASRPIYPEKVDYTGSIIWIDSNDKDGLRPDSLEVQLTNNSTQEIQSLTVIPDESDNWNYQFENLQKYDDTKTEYEYTASLVSIPDEYTLRDSGNGQFTLTHRSSGIGTYPDTSSEDSGEDILITEEEKTLLKNAPEPGLSDSASSFSDNTGTSDGLKTTSIPITDQVDPTEPLDPNNGTADSDSGQEGQYEDLNQDTTSTPDFTLGDAMEIHIVNYDTDYKTNPKPDANYFSLGVLVEANGKRAFLSGDINNYEGTETALAEQLGSVDILTLGHHGYYGSNTYSYITRLDPEIMVIAGTYSGISNKSMNGESGTLDTLIAMGEKGSKFYATEWYHDSLPALIFNFDRNLTSNIPDGLGFIGAARHTSPAEYIYYYDGLPTAHTGWLTSNGYTRYYQNSCRNARLCWLKESDGRYSYLDEDGTKIYGWINDKGTYYYLKKDGYLAKGWFKDNDFWYYLDSSTGAMKTGWLKDNNSWYYLNSNGTMAAGMTKIGSSTYYLDPSSGKMKTGWLSLSDGWYYFDPNGVRYEKGWHWINGKCYYMYNSSIMAADTWIGSDYVDASGVWIKDYKVTKNRWVKYEDRWWYRHTDGSYTRSNWEKINTNWYYFDASGWMLTGWLKLGSTWYYLEDNGAMVSSCWKWIDGKCYYFFSSGAMAVNTRIDGYYVDASGAWIPGK